MASQIIQLEVKSDDDRLVRQMNADVRSIPKILSQAVNKTITKAATVADVEIRKTLNVKQRTVKGKFTIFKSNSRKQTARLKVLGGAFPLINFNAKQTKKGVTFKVKKNKGRKILKGAFIATMQRGHKGVFLRKFKKRLKGKKRALPIEEAFSTNIFHAFTNKQVTAALVAMGRDTFFKEFKRLLIRQLKNRRK